MSNTGFYPRMHVDTANVPAVGHAGGVLLTETIRATGLGTALSEALSPWRKPFAVHDLRESGVGSGRDACSWW